MVRFWSRLLLVVMVVLLRSASQADAIEQVFGGGVATYAPQLSLELSTLAAAVEPGQLVEFELMVNNHGPNEGQGI